jgi:hypothetical protein
MILFRLQHCRKDWEDIRKAYNNDKTLDKSHASPAIASLDVKWLISQEHGIGEMLRAYTKPTGPHKTKNIPVFCSSYVFEAHPLYVSHIALFLLFKT